MAKAPPVVCDVSRDVRVLFSCVVRFETMSVCLGDWVVGDLVMPDVATHVFGRFEDGG